MSPETETILVHRNKTIENSATNCTSTKYPAEKKNNCENLSNGKVLDDSVLQQQSSNGFIDKIIPLEEAHHANAHQDIGTDLNFKREIVWFNAIGFLVLHLLGVVGLVIMMTGRAYAPTVIYFIALTFLSGMGITMGAHRLFSHRSYKAKTWLKIALLIMHTMAGQNCLYVWVRDHRQHHKYSDTDADPHNATRGFFFSHVGWLMSRKHPKVIEYGKKIDMSDMEADYWVMFQKHHYKLLYIVFTLILPTALPCYLWGENMWISFFATFFARYIVQLNFTWSVNSAAHMFGNKPYDKNILSAESVIVSIVAGGEGWHNYHHTFPWDYRTAELGMPFNATTKIIDFLAEQGAVYDRKTVTPTILRSRIQRTGDGTHHAYGTEALAQKAAAAAAAADVDEGAALDSNGLRKYIVEKNRINKLMIDELEKLKQAKSDDLNNNNNNNNNNESCSKAKLNINDLAKSTSPSITKDKQALNA